MQPSVTRLPRALRRAGPLEVHPALRRPVPATRRPDVPGALGLGLGLGLALGLGLGLADRSPHAAHQDMATRSLRPQEHSGPKPVAWESTSSSAAEAREDTASRRQRRRSAATSATAVGAGAPDPIIGARPSIVGKVRSKRLHVHVPDRCGAHTGQRWIVRRRSSRRRGHDSWCSARQNAPWSTSSTWMSLRIECAHSSRSGIAVPRSDR